MAGRRLGLAESLARAGGGGRTLPLRLLPQHIRPGRCACLQLPAGLQQQRLAYSQHAVPSVQVRGRKRFLLAPPEAHPELRPFPFLHPSHGTPSSHGACCLSCSSCVGEEGGRSGLPQPPLMHGRAAAASRFCGSDDSHLRASGQCQTDLAATPHPFASGQDSGFAAVYEVTTRPRRHCDCRLPPTS